MDVKAAARAGQRGKSIEEVVAYALGHRIRILVLAILNEGTYSPDELARIIDEPLNKVSHHIKELVEAGSIELARVEKVRNADQHFYRAVEMPFYTDEEVAAMTPQQQQIGAGLILQSMFAEAMSSLWAGKMQNDPRIWLAWRWFNVDEEGRNEIADEQQRFWDRMQEIEADATNRRANSGEDGVRARKAPTAPPGSAGAE
jgi:DNA-binding transcriptional ArsR family regulator